LILKNVDYSLESREAFMLGSELSPQALKLASIQALDGSNIHSIP
jgi:hypothetical protein